MSFNNFKNIELDNKKDNGTFIDAANQVEERAVNVLFGLPTNQYNNAAERQLYQHCYTYTNHYRTDNIYYTDDYNTGLEITLSKANMFEWSGFTVEFIVIPKNQNTHLFDAEGCTLLTSEESITLELIDVDNTQHTVVFTKLQVGNFVDVVQLWDYGVKYVTSDSSFSSSYISLVPYRESNAGIAIKVSVFLYSGNFISSGSGLTFNVSFNKQISTYPISFGLNLETPSVIKRNEIMIVDRPINKTIFVVLSAGAQNIDIAQLTAFLDSFAAYNSNLVYDPVATKTTYANLNLALVISQNDNTIYQFSVNSHRPYLPALLDGYKQNGSLVTSPYANLGDPFVVSPMDMAIDDAKDEVIGSQEYQIDIIDIFDPDNEVEVPLHWWTSKRAYKDDRITIRRFSKDFVESFVYGKCYYDSQLYNSFVNRGSLGLTGEMRDTSAVVTDTVVCDKLRGAQIYATPFAVAGINPNWTKMEVITQTGLEMGTEVIKTNVASDELLVFKLYSNYGRLFIDLGKQCLWVVPTTESYRELCGADDDDQNPTTVIARAANTVSRDDLHLLDIYGGVGFSLRFTYEFDAVTYEHNFALVGRDHPDLQIRKPEYYNNYTEFSADPT